MLISDRLIALALFAAALTGGSAAHAFEVKDQPVESAPAAALQKLPSVALPDLGVGKSVRDMMRGFRESYDQGDKRAALKQLEEAAERGDILARWKAARMLSDGDGVQRDDFKAFQHYSRIANTRGDESKDSPLAGVVASSFVALGQYWRQGIDSSPIKPNAGHALKMFNYAATYYGNSEAQFRLGAMWLDGSAGQKDPLQAARWLNLAAEKGHGLAQALLGRMLFLGEAMPRNQWRGLMWLKIARENAQASQEAWVQDMHQKAFDAANEEERKLALRQAERFIRSSERK